ncbi:hypothetical protein [Paraoerskovia sediminicola]|uniref:hypothetical protein n=1 Tax=Paraoerskovia sediminicola TaxID=1138587 RepID=UPI002572DCB0|nr:hypothetical protein [Paraoerskovia sediminicola]
MGEQLLYAQAELPGVGETLTRVTERRLDVVTRLLTSAGFTPDEARARATIALATVVGAEQLALATPALVPTGADARRVRELSLAMVVGRTAPTAPGSGRAEEPVADEIADGGQ